MKETTAETRTITAADFKAKCLQLMDEVNETGLTLIVTKRGRPVMRASAPVSEQKPFRSIFGRTPGAQLPSDSKWRTMKDQWADEWDESTDSFSALLNDAPEDQR